VAHLGDAVITEITNCAYAITSCGGKKLLGLAGAIYRHNWLANYHQK